MFHRWAVVAGNGTQQLYIGRKGECQNMARKFMGAFLDGAFVAMQNAAPAHPTEGVPAQIETLRSELAEEKEAADNWRRLALQFDNHRMQALGHLKAVTNPEACFDKYKAAKEFLNAPPLDGEAVLAQRIAALAATQPAAQGVDVVQAAKALCKHAAKVQNVNFDDYWLIHAEEFKEEAQIVLDAAQAKQGEQQ
jgi:hypothetical protein